MKSRTRWSAAGAVVALAAGLGAVGVGPAQADAAPPLWSDWADAAGLSGCIVNGSFEGEAGVPASVESVVLALPASMASFPGALEPNAWSLSWVGGTGSYAEAASAGTATARTTGTALVITIPVSGEMRTSLAQTGRITVDAALGESALSWLGWTGDAPGSWPFENAVVVRGVLHRDPDASGTTVTVQSTTRPAKQVCFGGANDVEWGDTVTVSLGSDWNALAPAVGVTNVWDSDSDGLYRHDMTLKAYTYDGDPANGGDVDACSSDIPVTVSASGDVTFTLPSAPPSGCSHNLTDYAVSASTYGNSVVLPTYVFIGLTVKPSTLKPLGVFGGTELALTTQVGVAPILPDVVTVQYEKDAWDDLARVTWDAIDPALLAQPGTFKVTGVVGDTGFVMTATITVVETPVTPPATQEPTHPATGGEELGGTINGAGSVRVPQGAVVSLAGHGFLPGEDVTATLHSTPVLLGTYPANAAGEVAFQARIPAGTAVGEHTVVLKGTSSGRTVSLAVTVTATGGNLPAAANG